MAEKDTIREQLSAYLDEELPDAEARRIAEALRRDPQLAQELEALRATRRMVHNLSRAEAPDDFVANVLARAERARLVGNAEMTATTAKKPLRWIRWAAAVAGLLIVFTAGISFYHAIHMETFESRMNGHAKDAAASPYTQADRVEIATRDQSPEPIYRGKAGKGDHGRDDGAARKDRISKEATTPAMNVVLYATDPAVAQQQVEAVLRYNGVAPVETNAPKKALAEEAGNRFQANPITANQVEYVANVTPTQAANINRQLNDLQDNQRRTQLAMLTSHDRRHEDFIEKNSTPKAEKCKDSYGVEEQEDKLSSEREVRLTKAGIQARGAESAVTEKYHSGAAPAADRCDKDNNSNGSDVEAGGAKTNAVAAKPAGTPTDSDTTTRRLGKITGDLARPDHQQKTGESLSEQTRMTKIAPDSLPPAPVATSCPAANDEPIIAGNEQSETAIATSQVAVAAEATSQPAEQYLKSDFNKNWNLSQKTQQQTAQSKSHSSRRLSQMRIIVNIEPPVATDNACLQLIPNATGGDAETNAACEPATQPAHAK